MIPLPVIIAELIMALGGALLVANVWALLKPRLKPGSPPIVARGRALAMSAIGALVLMWGFASFVTRLHNKS